MPPRLSWRHLIPGLLALTAIVAVIVVVLTFAGVGKVRGDTVRIHVLTDQARGLMPGSEVWLDGQKVGVVDHVGFRPPSTDTLHRVVIASDIREEAAARLRHDSRIRVRPGGNVIGPVVVFIESGTPTGLPVQAGDTLRALAQSDAEVVLEKVGGATSQLPALLADARTVVSHGRNPDGTLGAFLAQGLDGAEMRSMRDHITALQARFGDGAAAARRATLRRHASAALARVDSVRALLASPNTSLGRFRRDSTLVLALARISSELDSLERNIAESPGTLTRLREDSALVRSVAGARAEMTLLMADVKRHPLRYIHF